MRRIGVLLGAPADEDDADAQARVVAFQQAMQQLGWTDGRNMQIDIRRGGGDAERIRKYAVELAALAPEVIVTAGASTVTPLLHATRTVPIVFTTVVDPVGAQVSSIAWRDRAATPPASCSSSTA
jgi:putative ABC transport system substrate-binding protein